MSAQKISLISMHFDHKMWLSKLSFAKDELPIYERLLGDLVLFYDDDKDFMRNVEHFQNQFIKEREVIDTLLHEVHVHEDVVLELAKDRPTHVYNKMIKDHASMRDKMKTFDALFTDLRIEFKAFAAKWLKFDLM